MKTKEELNALKKEIETMKGKLSELTEEEMVQVTGGRENIVGNSFAKSITLISAGICGKLGKGGETLSVTPSSKTLATNTNENADEFF